MLAAALQAEVASAEAAREIKKRLEDDIMLRLRLRFQLRLRLKPRLGGEAEAEAEAEGDADYLNIVIFNIEICVANNIRNPFRL